MNFGKNSSAVRSVANKKNAKKSSGPKTTHEKTSAKIGVNHRFLSENPGVRRKAPCASPWAFET